MEDTLSERAKESTTSIRDSDHLRRRQLLTEAIERHWPTLLAGIQVYVKRFGLAEDRPVIEELSREILQDTVVTALQKAGNYNPARQAYPWLLGIALNHIRRLRRTQGYERRHITPVADMPQIRRATQQSDSGMLSEDEMFDLLYESTAPANSYSQPMLDELLSLVGHSDQEVLKLAFVDGLRGKSLAAELGISEGAAWARLSRAIARLRKAYLQSEQASGEER